MSGKLQIIYTDDNVHNQVTITDSDGDGKPEVTTFLKYRDFVLPKFHIELDAKELAFDIWRRLLSLIGGKS